MTTNKFTSSFFCTSFCGTENVGGERGIRKHRKFLKLKQTTVLTLHRYDLFSQILDLIHVK